MTPEPTVLVLSGHYPGTRFASPANHVAYAKAHGYTYIHCNWPTGSENPYFNKISYVEHYLPHFDYVFWIDDDAFFLDLGRSVEPFLPSGAQFLSICSSPSYKAIRTPISSGQFIISRVDRSYEFLRSTATTSLSEVASWWRTDLGMFTNGDQDAMYYQLMTDPRFEGGATIFPHTAFNSRVDELGVGPAPFVLHFTGTLNRKLHDYKSTQRTLGVGPSLLPRSVEDHLMVQPLVGPYRTVLREVRRQARLASVRCKAALLATARRHRSHP
jgi:hypothetical protein